MTEPYQVTYEDWCNGGSKRWLAEAAKYNEWRKVSLATLLSDIGPRIDALSGKGYAGCGFRYDMIRSFGNLVVTLAMSWHPSANHLDKISDDHTNTIVSEVLFDCLLETVAEAELTSKMTHTEIQEYMDKKRAREA